MIPSNRGIHRALDERRLVIDPEPQPRQPSVGGPPCPYDTTAVDLRLGRYISVPEAGPFNFDLRSSGLAAFLVKHSKQIDISQGEGFVLKPNQFILAQTLERITLPIPRDDNTRPLAARIEGKSSCARTGILVHFTAPTVHAGWDGPLTLEMINLGLIVEKVDAIPFANLSQFQGQVKPAGTKL